MSEFSLPTLGQDQFSTYYGVEINGTNEYKETVVYPGKQLTVSTKSRNLKKYIAPANVFITKIVYKGKRADEFSHKLYGVDKQWSVLPKRLYSQCFPKIHLGSIPPDNRIKIQLTDSIHVTLPYVPDEFYKQKQQKATRISKPITRRGKRQRVVQQAEITDDDYDGWGVYGMSPTEPESISKDKLMKEIRSVIDEIHNKGLSVKNPFGDESNLTSSEENKQTLITIIQFVYHYAREELRMQQTDDEPVRDDLWNSIKNDLH